MPDFDPLPTVIAASDRNIPSSGKYFSLLLVFTVGFIVVYAGCIFSPIRTAHLVPGEEVTEMSLNFQWRLAFIAAVAGCLVSLVYFLLRKNRTYVVRIVFNDAHHTIELFTMPFFGNKTIHLLLDYSDTHIVLRKKGHAAGATVEIIFVYRQNEIAVVASNDNVWENEPVKFKILLAKVRALYPQDSDSNKHS